MGKDKTRRSKSWAAVRNLTLVSLMGVGLSRPAAATGLNVGRSMPAMQFTNIHGVEVDSSHYSDRVQIYTFADRHSSEALMDWLSESGIEAMISHPDARFAYLNFADVSEVPVMARDIASAAIALVDNRSSKKLHKSFEERGVTLSEDKAVFHLTPDWDGSFLNAFQIEHAKSFHCWIVVNGEVVAQYNGDMVGLQGRYLEDLNRILKN